MRSAHSARTAARVGAALARHPPRARPCHGGSVGEAHEGRLDVGGTAEAAQQRVADDLRTQLARAEEFAATLRERLPSPR
ncbi:hypothetical protein [Streptomyces longhuiensis]|uniref:hypothetical protein n=1 Tax=Streptomyces longhuiensis TaxID=2880933 RepID=UPI001D0A5173|nr:hypothetical protein [Streptomyces longhuiensis]UDL97333.1 hypothetical protein LGI35_03175 [Streptomyces longhuiensis]